MADNTPVCSFAMAHIKCTICKHVNVQPDKSMQMCSGRGCAEWASTCDLKGTGAWAFEAWKKRRDPLARHTTAPRKGAAPFVAGPVRPQGAVSTSSAWPCTLPAELAASAVRRRRGTRGVVEAADMLSFAAGSQCCSLRIISTDSKFSSVSCRARSLMRLRKQLFFQTLLVLQHLGLRSLELCVFLAQVARRLSWANGTRGTCGLPRQGRAASLLPRRRYLGGGGGGGAGRHAGGPDALAAPLLPTEVGAVGVVWVWWVSRPCWKELQNLPGNMFCGATASKSA